MFSIIFAIISFLSLQVLGYTQYVEVYPGENYTGDSVIITSKYAALTQELHAIVNSAKSYCVQGSWRGYENENFTGEWTFFGEYIERTCRQEYVNETTGIQSLRFHGPEDTSLETVSFYDGSLNDRWSGTEVTLDQSANNFGFVPSGVVVTGFSNWTLFSDDEYTDIVTCLRSSTMELYGISLVNLTVKSVRQGCQI